MCGEEEEETRRGRTVGFDLRGVNSEIND